MPAKKVPTTEKPVKTKKEDAHRKKRRMETFSIYIYKVLKQVHRKQGFQRKL